MLSHFLYAPRIMGTTLPNKAYHPPATSKNPLAGVTQAVFSRTPMTLLMFPAALAASNHGDEYPKVYEKRRNPPERPLLELAAP